MRLLRDQRGFTLTELLVTSAMFIVVMTGILMMTTVAFHSQTRATDRVAAVQRARPVMTRLVQNLHSACVAPRVTPVLAGSNATSVSFLSKSGSSVNPTPDLRVVSLSGTTLTETIYPATGGAAPVWTFSGTPSSTRTLLTDVTAPGNVLFRYFDYVNGVLNTVPLTVPLTSTFASRTVNVSMTMVVAPAGGASTLDNKSPITLSDSADLRLESASPIAAQDNLPCV